MGLICLLGRHGTGKSSIGHAMRQYGYEHLSVGLLRRLASNGQYPSDIPVVLMAAMRRAKAGHPLADDIANKLLKHAMSFKDCVLDGFPSTIEHLSILPPGTTYGVVWTPACSRADRLVARAESTKRNWTPGLHSTRESALAGLIAHLRKEHRVVFINNAANGKESVALVAEKLAMRLKR